MFGFNEKPQAHFIVMLGDDGIILAAHHVPDAPAPFYAAHHDEIGAARIISLISAHPDAAVTLFADMLAQDFRREAVPRLDPLDRHRLIKRRLRQAFPHALLTATIFLNADRDMILLAGLHDNEYLSEWLTRLHSRMPRICLLPVECAGLVSLLLPDADDGWALMVSRQRTGGFRQIVTHKGEFVFTRLTPPLPLEASDGDIAEAVRRDITATLGYLARFGLTDTLTLRVIMLAPEESHDILQTITLPVHSLTLLSPHKAARHFGFPFAPDAAEAYSDLLHAGHLAHKKKPLLPLMLPQMKKTRQTETIRNWGMRGAAAMLAIALVSTLWQASGLFALMLETHRQTSELSALKQQLTDKQTSAAPVTEPLGRLRQAVERQRLYAEPSPLPWAALQQLNQGLGEQAKLVKLSWHDDGNAADEALDIQTRITNAPAAKTDRETVVAASRRIVEAIVHAMPDYAVDVTHYPFPALPQDTLSNDNAAKDADADGMTSLSIKRVMR